MDSLLFPMEISWDRATPTQEQWDTMGRHTFEYLEDIKGTQSTISSRALSELLHHLGHTQASTASSTKPQMAASIVGALTPHEGWAMADLNSVHLASSSCDAVDLALLAFGLELVSNSSIRLFFLAWCAPLTANVEPEEEALPPECQCSCPRAVSCSQFGNDPSDHAAGVRPAKECCRHIVR